MTTAGRRRLTRAESQERTRALIIDAAATLFLDNGFRATSLEQIGEAAGFTRGAVYSNFADKAAMGAAVIDELYRREGEKIQTLIDTVPAAELFDALSKWGENSIGNPRWMRLEIEVAAFSSGNGTNRAATSERYKRLRALARQLIDRFIGESSVAVDRDMLAAAFVSMALGFGTQRAVDPTLSGTQLSDFLRMFVGLLSRV